MCDLFRSPPCHDLVALQSMLGHHVICQLCTLLCCLGKSGDLFQHRLEQGLCKSCTFCLIDGGETVFTQIRIFVAGYIFNSAGISTFCFQYGFHCLFQSKHTVLYGFLHLIQSTADTLLIKIACLCFPVFHAVAVTEHDIVFGYFVIMGLAAHQCIFCCIHYRRLATVA